jgi:hypothetical protein
MLRLFGWTLPSSDKLLPFSSRGADQYNPNLKCSLAQQGRGAVMNLGGGPGVIPPGDSRFPAEDFVAIPYIMPFLST